MPSSDLMQCPPVGRIVNFSQHNCTNEQIFSQYIYENNRYHFSLDQDSPSDLYILITKKYPLMCLDKQLGAYVNTNLFQVYNCETIIK